MASLQVRRGPRLHVRAHSFRPGRAVPFFPMSARLRRVSSLSDWWAEPENNDESERGSVGSNFYGAGAH